MRSSVRPTIHGLGFVYCIQSAWKKWPTIWHADVSRWLTLSVHGCLWILLLVCLSVHLSVYSFTAIFRWLCICKITDLISVRLSNHLRFFFFFLLFFFIFFSKVRVGAKKGGSHYWEMAVAITCGYGGYLLPLLAAHSSFQVKFLLPELVRFWISDHYVTWKKNVFRFSKWKVQGISVVINGNIFYFHQSEPIVLEKMWGHLIDLHPNIKLVILVGSVSITFIPVCLKQKLKSF